MRLLRSRFLQVFERPSYVWINTVPAIHDLAGDLRQALKLRTSDAIHLASAMRIRADALHTFDDGLLKLDGKAAVNNLRICKPRAVQTELAL